MKTSARKGLLVDGAGAPLVEEDSGSVELLDGTRISYHAIAPDNAAGVRELFRVLRPGGRASVFEPINRIHRDDDWTGGRSLSAIQPEHDRIVEYLQQGLEQRNPMLDFDERDLTCWFVEAGFTEVRLNHEMNYRQGMLAI